MSDLETKVSLPDEPVNDREARLKEIRRKADRMAVKGREIEIPKQARASANTGYYGVPLLKAPAWSAEIPIYFFAGGAAGSAAMMAAVARLTGVNSRLARDAQYLAAIGGAISPALLVADLGMPSRFLNMLRVFKIQSPMSVGSWTLMAFSSSSAAAAFFCWARQANFGRFRAVENLSQFVAAVSGAVISTYTGVLIGATAIPVWNQNVSILPVHFAFSGMAAAGSMLELAGHDAPALNTMGIAASLGETIIGVSIELRKNPALKPLKTGKTGWLTRLGGLLSGPVPLVLRLLALGASGRRKSTLRKIAAGSAVAGSFATRFAWTQAGIASAQDPTIPLEITPNS